MNTTLLYLFLLTTNLGHDDFRVREEASTKLLAIGNPALPFLDLADKSPDPEVRHRAKVIRDRLWCKANPYWTGQPQTPCEP